jgi:hypothetical protein
MKEMQKFALNIRISREYEIMDSTQVNEGGVDNII